MRGGHVRLTKEYNQLTAAAASSQTTAADKQTTDTPDHKAKANDDETKQTKTLPSSLPPLFQIQNQESDSF